MATLKPASIANCLLFRKRIPVKSASFQNRRIGRPSKPRVSSRWYQKNRITKSTEKKKDPIEKRIRLPKEHALISNGLTVLCYSGSQTDMQQFTYLALKSIQILVFHQIVNQKMYLYLTHCKIETKCPILEI